ncbi:uncharacterized protein LOC111365002 [Spodoptera litura]|uniref:Uncharacterized protein LOC111349450 n=1 Tax=Spodoptera litura TaxID=69820 RepID=A0A9J7EJY1_SPOLT|nr:uncharacterized protein LOC111349450 [Spodoptera litura]XP_022822677.1 uncharacterized protein LOC111353757 [Spodoptera litura]XP_022828026.1 uncharacterized protein LOC111357514 [Spodoptera litura]XP_022828624.1 uncharacterized protein LOC111357997 [Spodoptera litura]XP_022829867.1 uncharacterized protein LOC111358797 [Spodoptera litura]XP_022831784.1 uncharacterized protein LOC111360146 [Spodoptera litura]XP_022837872.1 uncharacterized protein LOC111365002 [Spodoptera litura]
MLWPVPKNLGLVGAKVGKTKAKIKQKLATIRRQSMLTGRGPPPEQLNEKEQLVLAKFCTAALVGHIDALDLATPSTAKVGMYMAAQETSGSRGNSTFSTI